MTNELAILLDQPLDPNAIEIGRLIRNGANGNRCYLEAGYKLILTKESHAHGEWLIWLHDNAKALGFSDDRTARRFMASANRALAPDLEPDEAKRLILQLDPAEARRRIERAVSEANPIELSRQIWGHVLAQHDQLQDEPLEEPSLEDLVLQRNLEVISKLSDEIKEMRTLKGLIASIHDALCGPDALEVRRRVVEEVLPTCPHCGAKLP